MMSVEQVMDSIRRNDTVAAKQHVVVEAYDRLWRDALDETAWRKRAMVDARDHLACGETTAAWTALTRHEVEPEDDDSPHLNSIGELDGTWR